MVVVSILPHAEFGRIDYRKDAPALPFETLKSKKTVKYQNCLSEAFRDDSYPKGKAGCFFPMVNLSEFRMRQYRDEKPSGRSFRSKVRPMLTFKSFLRVEQFYLFPLIPSGAVLFVPFEFNRSSSIYSGTH